MCKYRRTAGRLVMPFQMYPAKITGAQGYLTKLPSDFVKRWSPLTVLVEALGVTEEKLSAATDTYLPPAVSDTWTAAEFRRRLMAIMWR
jgi:hypothetical protein